MSGISTTPEAAVESSNRGLSWAVDAGLELPLGALESGLGGPITSFSILETQGCLVSTHASGDDSPPPQQNSTQSSRKKGDGNAI